jgi:hypothetical protein
MPCRSSDDLCSVEVTAFPDESGPYPLPGRMPWYIDVVNRCYGLLSELLNSPGAGRIIATLKERDPLPRWNDPEDPPAGDRR